ncbi:MAG: trigger factor [Sulfurovaceae bacterium]|nr:trigger factor [Sulfurovaceae bacterium]
MKVTVNKIDEANMLFSATIPLSDIDKRIDTLAQQAGKSMKVDGFRKGKVPAHVVKKLHGEKLANDAEGEAVRNILNEGSKEAKLNQKDLIGEPFFKKFERGAKGIDVEIEVSVKPTFELGDYSNVVKKPAKPKISKKVLDERIEGLVTAQAPFEKIKEDRGLASGDMAVIDFVGSVDGVEFDGGKAENFSLKIGSGQFIPGFEDQMIGMKAGKTKVVKVKFPENYGAANLAGKDAEFKVTLHEIQVKAKPELNDELAAKLLQGKEGANVEMLKEQITEQLQREEISKKYHEELKPALVEALVAKYSFALPNNIVEQEIDAKLNQKASQMSKEEIEELKSDVEKIKAMREELRGEASDSVKATFIVDALAKAENISVNDQEVSQVIYYEAMMSGQDPQKVMEYYSKNNLLPAIKMGIIEDKLFSKILGLEE